VPRYYFNFCCDRFEATDVVGEYCRNPDAARQQAMRQARDIVRKNLLQDELTQAGWIEVEDEAHRAVMKVPLRAVAY
jgi:predicted alternative tryptophan synthase beta-subunit